MADSPWLIYGPEQLLVDRAIAKALKQIRSEVPDLQITTIDASDDDAAAQFTQAASPTLFGDGICVIVTNADSADESLAAVLIETAERADPWLIVVHPGGVKGKRMLEALRSAGATQIDCPAIKKGRPMLDYLAREIAAHKRRVTPDALPALVEALGPDVAMLSAAIDQLVSDIDHDPITVDDVRSTFGGVAEVAGWTIADRVWERNIVEALTDLRWSMQSTDGARLGPSTIAALSRGLRSMVMVGMSPPGASDADVAREVGVPPWQVKNLRRQWSTWSGDRRRVARAIVDLAESDGAMKGGVSVALDAQQKLFALERLVVQLAGPRD